MILRLEYYATADVLLNRRVVALRAHLQLFFLRLFFLTDGAGRFRADAAEIRAGLYAHELQQVSQRDVTSRLQELHEAGLIKLYTEAGVGYGKVADEFWQQRDRLRKVRHPGESPDAELPFGTSSPPPRKKPQATSESESPTTHFTSIQSTSEGMQGEAPPPAAPRAPTRAAAPAADLRPAAECVAELAARWPEHDVPAQLRAATRYVRKQRADETAEITVAWFVTHWMPGAAKRKAPPPAAPAPAAPAPAITEAARLEQLRSFAESPEPPRDSFQHQLWLEARAALAEQQRENPAA